MTTEMTSIAIAIIFGNHLSAAHNHHNNNAYTTQETSTLKTSTVVTPVAGANSKTASPPTVSPYISLFSPVMAHILPLSPYKYSPMHLFTSHVSVPVNKPCIPAKFFNKPPLPKRSTLHGLQTSKRTHIDSLSTQTSHAKVSAKSKPTNPREVEKTDNNNTKPVIKCFVVKRDHSKPKIRTSRKPQIPRLSDTVSHFIQTRTKVTLNSVNKPHVVYGTDSNNTKSVKKHIVSEVNDTMPKNLTSEKPRNPYPPRLSDAVSHFIQTRSRETLNGKLAKPVNKYGPDNNNTESMKKRFVSNGNDTKPKMPSSKKLHIPSAPRHTVTVSKFIQTNNTTPNSKQAKPRVAGKTDNNTKSMTKRYIPNGNDNKSKILTSIKPQVPSPPKPTVVSNSIKANHTKVTPNGEQAKRVKKPCVVVGTENRTKPKGFISTKQPSPPKCSNLSLQTSRPNAGLSLSAQTTHTKVTPKGCIQRWRF